VLLLRWQDPKDANAITAISTMYLIDICHRVLR